MRDKLNNISKIVFWAYIRRTQITEAEDIVKKNLDGILDYFAYKKTNESYQESTILYSYKKEIYRALKT
jgi:hypothetical protein